MPRQAAPLPAPPPERGEMAEVVEADAEAGDQEAAAGAALRRGSARRGVRLRAVAGAEGRGLLRLRVPPVARGSRRRRAAAGGVRQDHLPLIAQAARAKGAPNAVLYQAE